MNKRFMKNIAIDIAIIIIGEMAIKAMFKNEKSKYKIERDND